METKADKAVLDDTEARVTSCEGQILGLAKSKVSRLRIYKMRVLKYYVENKAQLETWK